MILLFFFNYFFKMINIEGKSRVLGANANGGGGVMEGLRWVGCGDGWAAVMEGLHGWIGCGDTAAY